MKGYQLLLFCFVVFFVGAQSAPTPASSPPDDYSQTKQHAALLRDGPFGPEVGLIGSSQGNTKKGYGLIRGKVQVNEKKGNAIVREIGEEASHSKKNIAHKSKQVQTKTAHGDQVEGYVVHLKQGAKQDMQGENRKLRFVHHTQVEKHLKDRPEQKALYKEMQNKKLIKNRYPTQPRKPLERSTSLNSSSSASTAKTSPSRRLGRSFSGKHR